MNPFVGTWNASIEKSRRHANHQFQSATLTFAVTGDSVSMTHAGVNMSGQQARTLSNRKRRETAARSAGAPITYRKTAEH
jgi:hypothetical protein